MRASGAREFILSVGLFLLIVVGIVAAVEWMIA